MKAVLFALDGLLVDNAETLRTNFRQAASESGFKKSFRDIDIEGRCAAVKVSMIGCSDTGMRLKILSRNEELNHLAALSEPPAAVVGPALQVLRNEGYRLGLCTNNSRLVGEAYLSSSGLRDCFEECVYADDVFNAKPDPEGYQLLLARMDLTASECCIVESTEVGFTAAGRVRPRARMRVTFEEMGLHTVATILESE